MLKFQEKTNANFKSVYGDSLVLNVSKSNGGLKVSIKHKSYNFFKEKSVFMGGILCAIAILRSLLDINTCLMIIGICCIFYIVYESIFVIREEKVLIIKGFGCHISKKHLIGKRTIFIPYEQIEKVFINEVIFRHRVIYLLTLITKEWTKEKSGQTLVPLFLNLLPRIDCLQIIYKNIKCLESR